MAQITATITAACQGSQNVVTYSDLSDPNSVGGDTYSWYVVLEGNPLTSGPLYRGEPLSYTLPQDGNYAFRVANDNVGEPSEYVYMRLNCGGTLVDPPTGGGGVGGGGGTPPVVVMGCTAPNALNYNAQATMDTTPSNCVFVEVPAGLSGLVAAHLPIPVVVRAAPTLTGLASLVVLVLETAPTPTTPDSQWVQVGRLRAICDAQATAHFNLSEAAKQLLSITPPTESGVDTSLSVLVRARYQVLDPATLDVKYQGLVGTCRALNAVVPPVEGAVLTTSTTYASVPTGKQFWQSAATYAGGVSSALLTRSADGCQARQFVWLNPKGAWDQGLFFGKHVHTTENDAALIYRDLSGADRYTSRGSVRPSIQVYSDVTDRPTYELLRGLRTSIQVYERLGPGQYVPVLVTAESFPEYTELTDKTFQVNFTVSYPALLIQTQ